MRENQEQIAYEYKKMASGRFSGVKSKLINSILRVTGK
jgi:hypothetical protein